MFWPGLLLDLRRHGDPDVTAHGTRVAESDRGPGFDPVGSAAADGGEARGIDQRPGQQQGRALGCEPVARQQRRLGSGTPGPGPIGASAPAFDSEETDTAYRLSADLPGMDPKAIEVRVEDGVLTVPGERKLRVRSDKARSYHLERRHGKFERAVRLPDNVKETQVKATYRNGVLELTLPKDPVDTARLITIN